MKIGIKKEDKAMRKELIMSVALLGAVAATLSCQKAQDVTPKTYSLSIEATKGTNDDTVKALALSGSTLNATWATTENVYVKKGDNWAGGSLQPQTAAETATLKGTLSGVTFVANDNITLQFPKSGDITYSGQVGTLEDIAANFDWATASASVASVDEGKITVDGDVAFQNQQAIVKFTLKNGDAALSTTKLVVKVESTEYEVNPASATSEIFVALPGFSSQAISLTATGSDSKTYIYSKSGVTFTNGKYYTRTVKMVDPNAPLSGVFSVGPGKTVKFSKGNLQATYNGSSWSWAFAANQWDFIGDAAANTSINGNGTVSANGTVDLFGWSTSATTLGINNSTSDIYTGDFADWGSNTTVQDGIGTGWRTLTSTEWTYLLNGRTSVTTRYCKATVNSKVGMVVFPDVYTHPTGVTAIASANTANAAYTTNSWSGENWTKMEEAGAIFLPAAGYRSGTTVFSVGSDGYYWSSTPNGTNNAYYLDFSSSNVYPASNYDRYYGRSVRLVQDQQ